MWEIMMNVYENFSHPFELIKDLFPKYAEYFTGEFLNLLISFPDFDPRIANGILFRQFSTQKSFRGINHIIICKFALFPGLLNHLFDASQEFKKIFLKLNDFKTSSIVSYLNRYKLQENFKKLQEISTDDFSLVNVALYHIKSTIEVELIRAYEVAEIF